MLTIVAESGFGSIALPVQLSQIEAQRTEHCFHLCQLHLAARLYDMSQCVVFPRWTRFEESHGGSTAQSNPKTQRRAEAWQPRSLWLSALHKRCKCQESAPVYNDVCNSNDRSLLGFQRDDTGETLRMATGGRFQDGQAEAINAAGIFAVESVLLLALWAGEARHKSSGWQQDPLCLPFRL